VDIKEKIDARHDMTKKAPLKIVKTDVVRKQQSRSTTQPPRQLGRQGLALWNAVMAEYSIDDIGGIEVLAQICAALDRAQQCSEQVDRDGPTIETTSGLREHPALKGELANRAFVTRNLQRLGLNIETLKPVGKPPAWSR
jgi:hypothetical protein